MRVLVSSSSSFWLSRKAVLLARELGAAWASLREMPVQGEPDCQLNDPEAEENFGYPLSYGLPRHDPLLLAVFDRLGDAMSGEHGGQIFEVEVPDDVTYFIGSHCQEWVAEQHRLWYSGGEESVLAGSYAFTSDSVYQPPPERSST